MIAEIVFKEASLDRELLLESRILIVDDNHANVALLERVLQHAGYRHFQSIYDSRELVTKVRSFLPDLILLDLMMPHMDGYTAIQRLHTWIPDGVYLPILVITADTSSAARQKALRLGAKDFLTKPIDMTEATLRIHNLLLTRRLYLEMERQRASMVEHGSQATVGIEAALRGIDRLESVRPEVAGETTAVRADLNRAASALSVMVSCPPPAIPQSVASPA